MEAWRAGRLTGGASSPLSPDRRPRRRSRRRSPRWPTSAAATCASTPTTPSATCAPGADLEEYFYDHAGQRVAVVTRESSGVVKGLRLFLGDTELEVDAGGHLGRSYAHLSLGTPVARIIDRGQVELQYHGLSSNTLLTVAADGTVKTGFVYGPARRVAPRASRPVAGVIPASLIGHGSPANRTSSGAWLASWSTPIANAGARARAHGVVKSVGCRCQLGAHRIGLGTHANRAVTGDNA